MTKLRKESEKLMEEGAQNIDDEQFFAIEADIVTNKEIFEEKLEVLKRMDDEIHKLAVSEDSTLEDDIIEAEENNRILRKMIVLIDKWLKR